MTIAQATARLRAARGPLEIFRARRDLANAWVARLAREGVTTTAEELQSIAAQLEARDAEVARWN